MSISDGISLAGDIIALFAALAAIYISNKQIKESNRQQRELIKTSDKQMNEQIKTSDRQLREQIEESRRLATEERQHQSRPIIVPKGEVSHNTVGWINLDTGEISEDIYESDGKFNWSWKHDIRIKLHNMGNGPAFNIHCVLYGPRDTCQDQFVSWDNGPIEEKVLTDIELAHSPDLRLHHNDFIDGMYPLYDRELDSPSNPWAYQIACLTITYHDLFRNKYVSILHYTLKYQWIHLATEKINGNPSFDLKELNEEKKRGPKLSVPLVQTSIWQAKERHSPSSHRAALVLLPHILV